MKNIAHLSDIRRLCCLKQGKEKIKYDNVDVHSP